MIGFRNIILNKYKSNKKSFNHCTYLDKLKMPNLLSPLFNKLTQNKLTDRTYKTLGRSGLL